MSLGRSSLAGGDFPFPSPRLPATPLPPAVPATLFQPSRRPRSSVCANAQPLYPLSHRGGFPQSLAFPRNRARAPCGHARPATLSQPIVRSATLRARIPAAVCRYFRRSSRIGRFRRFALINPPPVYYIRRSRPKATPPDMWSAIAERKNK